MDGAGAGGAAPERRKQLTAAEAVNHKRQLAQMVERELALTGADSVTDFDDALQMVLVETAFGRYPKHLLDVYTGKVVGRQERGDVVKSWQHVEKMSAPGGATGDEGDNPPNRGAPCSETPLPRTMGTYRNAGGRGPYT